jgi:spermidine synthase
LLPLLGSQWSLTLIISLNFVLFALIVATQPGLGDRKRLWRFGAEATFMFVFSLFFIGPKYLTLAQTSFLGGEVLDYRESRDATFVVMGYESEQAGSFQQLLVNGRSYANNSPPGRRYMAMLAHLPVMIHPAPESALIACVGTGTTVGALTTHGSLEMIHAVDLSKDVFDFAPHFVPINHSFHEQSRVRMVAADARHHLLSSDETFDVITFEPPPPQDAGVVNLYSQEFYQLAKRRLGEGGVVAQWIPLDLDRKILPMMMIQAMRAEFPHVSLWISNRMEGIAVGSQHPLQIDLEVWRRRMQEPAVREDLAAIGIETPEDLAATFLAADDVLAQFVGDAPVVSDNHPRIEYFNLYPLEALRYDVILESLEPVENYLIGAAPDSGALDDARVVAHSIWLEHEATVLGDAAAARKHVARGLEVQPGNRYLQYLEASQAR